MKKNWLLTCLLAFSATLFAQTPHRLCLVVTALNSREPVPGATVRAGAQGATTDLAGRACLSNLPTGALVLAIHCIGYNNLELPVTLPQTDTLRLELAPEAADLEEIIVQSTRTNSRVEDSPTKVEVLGREDMVEENNLKPGNVASILGDYSGVQIQQTSLNSGNAGVRIQGLASRYTQVLRDGMPVYAGLAGDFGILQVQPLDLQQIELIKNPASTLFGGGAIAGVINFISKKPGAQPEHSLTLNQASLGESDLTVWSSARNKHLGYTFFGGLTRQNARDVDGDGFTDVARQRSATFHPRVFWYGKKDGRLSAGVTFNADNRTGGDLLAVEGAATSDHPYRETNTTRRTVADLQAQLPARHGAWWTAKGALGYFSRKRQYPGFTLDGRQQDWFAELAYQQNSREKWHYVAGLNFNGNRFEHAASDSLAFGNFSYPVAGVFAQTSLHLKKWELEGGFRLDVRPDWGVFPLPSAAALYHVNKHLFLRGGFGAGYAVPNPLTLDADFMEGDLRHQLAPDPARVSAERSAGGNLEWNYSRLFGESVSLTFNQQFFYTRFSNPVGNLIWPNELLLPRNLDQPLITAGLDNYLRLEVSGTEIYLGYTFVDARRHWTPDQPYVPYTPRHRVAGVLARDFGEHFRSGIEASWTGAQVREDGTETPSYLFMAAMVGWKFRHFDLVANCENLLDYRQNKVERVVLGTPINPVFVPLWAPVDGRVANVAVVWRW